LFAFTRFVPSKEANESNMAVMEVSLPSGFTVDRDSLPSLEISSHVKRVETRNGDTMVILYFDKVGYFDCIDCIDA
jgi:CD109 antigen